MASRMRTLTVELAQCTCNTRWLFYLNDGVVSLESETYVTKAGAKRAAQAFIRRFRHYLAYGRIRWSERDGE